VTQRSDVLDVLATSLIALHRQHPQRVAVDGVTASGKSTLADEVTRQGRTVIRMDDFHHLRQHRYRQGKVSARGYDDDAYDFESLSSNVLKTAWATGQPALPPTNHRPRLGHANQ
jgi:uridine kinase